MYGISASSTVYSKYNSEYYFLYTVNSMLGSLRGVTPNETAVVEGKMSHKESIAICDSFCDILKLVYHSI